jgi:hypothetical protein
MDLFTLLIAYNLKTPFAINFDTTEKCGQADPELPPIDVALLSTVTRKTKQPDRRRRTFGGRPATATGQEHHRRAALQIR